MSGHASALVTHRGRTSCHPRWRPSLSHGAILATSATELLMRRCCVLLELLNPHHRSTRRRGRWELEERCEFFATVLMPEPPQEPAAKKSSDETSAAPQPVVRSGSPVLPHRAFAPASLPSLPRGFSLSPSRLRSKTHAGVAARGFPSLVDWESAGPLVRSHSPPNGSGLLIEPAPPQADSIRRPDVVFALGGLGRGDTTTGHPCPSRLGAGLASAP